MNRIGSYLLLALWLITLSCKKASYQDALNKETMLTLVWNKAYEDDSLDKSFTGLQWALSFVGASLPNADPGLLVQDSLIMIDLNKIGFSENALEHMTALHGKIAASEEYRQNNAVDLGRYVTLLLSSPEHYYALTDVPDRLEALLSDYELNEPRGYVNNSGVSLEHRIIQYSDQDGFHQLFISAEVDTITGDTIEYETVDLMANGQPRFGIFEPDGTRRNFADPDHSQGGKPSKCMWCHESGIQPMFRKQYDKEGFLTYREFQDTLWKFKRAHYANQLELKDGVDYSKKQEHTLTEILYISFMEPSAERLSKEWGMPVEEVKEKLSSLDTHIHHEFPFLGDLYRRKEVARFAPFEGLPVAGSVREPSETEINYMSAHAQ